MDETKGYAALGAGTARETPEFAENPQNAACYAKNGDGTDTREQIAADVKELVRRIAEYGGRRMFAGTAGDANAMDGYAREAVELLGRQAAMMEREMHGELERAEAVRTGLRWDVAELQEENDALRDWEACYEQERNERDHWQRVAGKKDEEVYRLRRSLDGYARLISKTKARCDELEARAMPEGMELNGNIMSIRIARDIDYDGGTLYVLIGGHDE